MGVEQALPVPPENDRAFVDATDRHKTAPTGPTPRPVPTEFGGSHQSIAGNKNSWQRSPEVQQIIEDLQGRNNEISISLDPQTHEVVFEVLNSKTGETVRRLPIHDAAALTENGKGLTGLLLDATE